MRFVGCYREALGNWWHILGAQVWGMVAKIVSKMSQMGIKRAPRRRPSGEWGRESGYARQIGRCISRAPLAPSRSEANQHIPCPSHPRRAPLSPHPLSFRATVLSADVSCMLLFWLAVVPNLTNSRGEEVPQSPHPATNNE